MTENFQDFTLIYISGGRRLFAAVSVTELPEVEHLSPVDGVDPRHLGHHQDPDPQQAGQRGESEHPHASQEGECSLQERIQRVRQPDSHAQEQRVPGEGVG